MKLIKVAHVPDTYQNSYDLSLLKFINTWVFQSMISVKRGISWIDYIPYVSIAIGGHRLLRLTVYWFRVHISVDLFAPDWGD